jgi:hypothetical protein
MIVTGPEVRAALAHTFRRAEAHLEDLRHAKTRDLEPDWFDLMSAISSVVAVERQLFLGMLARMDARAAHLVTRQTRLLLSCTTAITNRVQAGTSAQRELDALHDVLRAHASTLDRVFATWGDRPLPLPAPESQRRRLREWTDTHTS